MKKKHGEQVISQQVMRAGISIGAQVREAEFAENRKDFAHKLYIELKEANETVYWLELLFATGFIDKKMFESIYKDAVGLLRMLASSIKTIKTRNRIMI